MALPFLAQGLYLTPQAAFPYNFHVRSSTSSGEQGETEGAIHLINSDVFRLYWLCLNLSYVMEFFLQTLVKRLYMSQKTMLVLQRILMSAATFTAIAIIPFVNSVCAFLSFLFMFIRRKHEITNFVGVMLGVTIYTFSGLFNPGIYNLVVYAGLPLLVITAALKAFADKGDTNDNKKKE